MSEEKLESDIDDWMGELSGEENPFDEEARLAMEGPPSTEASAPVPPSIPAAEPSAQSDIDSAPDNQEPDSPMTASAEEEEPLDQGSIDSLFNGGDETAAAPEMDQDHINQLLGENETPADSLPTDNLDEESIAKGIDEALDATMMSSNAPAAEEVAPPTLPMEKTSSEPDFGEFYQANMDELLSPPAEPAETTSDAPAMSQDDLDQLLSSNEEPAETAGDSPVMNQDDLDQLLSSNEEPAETAGDSPVMNQDDLDQLLNNVAAPAETTSDSPVMNQANLDQLLDSGAEPAEMHSGSPAMNQADLDQLLGNGTEAVASAVNTPSQEEMDQLFAKGAGEEDELFPAEPTAPPTPAEEEAFGFAGDELDDSGDWDSQAEQATDPAFLADLHDKPADLVEEKLVPPTEKHKITLPAWLLKAKGSRTLWSSAGACLVLLLGLAGYFFLQTGDKPPAIATAPPAAVVLPAEPPVAQVHPPVPVAPANYAPQVMEMALPLTAPGQEVNVELRGQDPDNDPLEFVITELPTAGRLTGSMPHLTYMPTGDFAGQDRFVYRASDGKAWSEPAAVLISGPPAAPEKSASAPEIKKPRQPLVTATDLTLQTISTAALDIDWRTIWQKANPSVPFSKKVVVEIVDKKLGGTLTRLDERHHRYAPDPYTNGKEWLRYRFKLAGHPSKIRQMNIEVQPGNPRPTIALRPLNQQAYTVGDTVVLDASPSRDARPATLVFSWQQTAGVPVQLETLHQNGSAVSFMVPSSFYSVNYPNPVIRVTAKNQAGQLDSQVITIKVQPNRQAALWNGLR